MPEAIGTVELQLQLKRGIALMQCGRVVLRWWEKIWHTDDEDMDGLCAARYVMNWTWIDWQ